eukprot:TRINITY_DN16728_c0_g1_i1.p1 TRINITY_DN16728_c0_g1~~TRINITY_DN16728_c0_g1_i1.p1  ORF type:complete len:443 (+),score=93.28 TRINITY_DN16728_c0_g1_i1:145-1329(+)
MCLDGTPTGFNYKITNNASHAGDWMIYFQGGGWCYDEMDCLGRTSSIVGSSKDWNNGSTIHGLMDSDCKQNPEFCNFNKVELLYCDGASFSGDRSDPVVVNGTKLYFKGQKNRELTFQTLVKTFNLGSAKRVIFTGCSAGGLAAVLHSNWAHSFLKENCPALEDFRTVPMSGFFLEHQNIAEEPVYQAQLQNIFELANSSAGVDQACVAHYTPTNNTWQCIFAQNVMPFITNPTFVINSALDYWQTICIYLAMLLPDFPNQPKTGNGHCNAFPDYRECGKVPDDCNATQITVMNQYMTDFSSILESTSIFSTNGNGAFIHSCHTHCEAQTPDYTVFAINGTTIQQAVAKWYTSPPNTPASANTYSPCHYHTGDTSNRSCNPTCGASTFDYSSMF